MEMEPLEKKYARSEAKWYRKRLARIAMAQPFTESAPPHSTEEYANQTVQAVSGFFKKLF